MRKPNKREIVRQKFGGLCAYSGTPLKDDWQVDHLIPKSHYIWLSPKHLRAVNFDLDDIENLIPSQRIINHYKRSLSIMEFKAWYLGGLHERLKKLPKKTNSPRTIERKRYLLEVAELFGITEDKPFSGVFYFETLTQ